MQRETRQKRNFVNWTDETREVIIRQTRGGNWAIECDKDEKEGSDREGRTDEP